MNFGGDALFNKAMFQELAMGPMLSRKRGKRVIGAWVVQPTREDLLFMKGLIETDKVKPVIDRCFPLQKAAEAFRYYGEGHARGNVIITMGDEA